MTPEYKVLTVAKFGVSTSPDSWPVKNLQASKKNRIILGICPKYQFHWSMLNFHMVLEKEDDAPAAVYGPDGCGPDETFV